MADNGLIKHLFLYQKLVNMDFWNIGFSLLKCKTVQLIHKRMISSTSCTFRKGVYHSFMRKKYMYTLLTCTVSSVLKTLYYNQLNILVQHGTYSTDMNTVILCLSLIMLLRSSMTGACHSPSVCQLSHP